MKASSRNQRTLLLPTLGLLALFSACGLHDSRNGGNGNNDQHARSARAKTIRPDLPAPVGDGAPLPVPPDTIVPPDLTDATAKTVVGNIPGASTVTPDGQAQYEIPIAVPPGRLGMQPDVSMLYQSRAPNGPLGVGWKLTGFSQITRCPHSYAVEGLAGPIKGNANDSYCLDGEYLKEVAESEFRTEQDKFARITIAYPDAGNFFTVYEKNGRISYYTNVSGDNASWLRTETDDRYGNTIVYSYTTNPLGSTGGFPGNYEYPLSIQYTGSNNNTALVANRTIKFTYEFRPHDQESWFSVSPMYMNARLKTIEAWGPSAQSPSVLLRTYTLYYKTNGDVTGHWAEESISSRSLISLLTETDASGNKLGQTSFAWELGATPTTSYGTTGLPQPQYVRLPTSVSDYAATDKKSGYRLVDFNGDGLDDLLYSIKDANNNIALAIRLRQWGHQDFGPAIPLNIHPSVAYDGSYTFAAPVLTSTSAPPSLLVWEQENGAPKPYASLIPLALVNGQPVVDTGRVEFQNFDTVFAADFDGDGLSDVVSGWSQPGSPSAYYLSLNTQQSPVVFAPGVALAVPSSVSGQAKVLGVTAQFRGTDFDGDGRQEMAVCFPSVKNSPTYIVSIGGFTEYNPTGFANPLVSCAMQAADSTNRQFFTDFNNDGQDDALWSWLDFDVGNGTGQNASQLRFAPGLNYPASAPILYALQVEDAIQPDAEIRVLDHNEDDHPDILMQRSLKGLGFPIYIGDYPDPGFITGGVSATPDQVAVEVGDVNGDGQDDVVTVEAGIFVVYQHDGNKADMLTRIVDGLGAETTFAYKPISDPTIYSPVDVSLRSYPLRAINGGIWAVGEHTVSAGSGIISSYFHKYAGGTEDIQRGFLGFDSHEIDWFRNDGTKVSEIQTFNNTHIHNVDPYVGQAVTDTTITQDQNGNVVHKRVASQNLSLIYDSGFGTYWSYPSSSSVVDYNPNASGALVATRTSGTSVTSIDAYGHVLTATTSEGSEQRTYTATYNYSPSNWLIDMLTKTVESQTISIVPPGGGRPTRSTKVKTVAYQYDSNGGLAWKVIEPNFDSSGNITPLPLPQYDGIQSLFINYLRDPDGQVRRITEDTNSSATPDQRSETIYRDGADRLFATRIADSLGRFTHIATEPSFGVVAAVQDQNGQYSRWRYDTFGRLKRSEPANAEPYTLSYVGWPATGVDPTKPSLELHELGDAGDEKVSQLDLLGQLVHRKVSDRNDGLVKQVDLNYDEERHLTSRTHPYFSNGVAYATDTFHYDPTGRPTNSVLADGKTEFNKYLGTTTGTQVDHWDAAPTDPTAIHSTALFDLGGRVTSNTQHAVANGTRPARDLTVSYSYGLFNMLASIVTPNGAMTNYQYDRLDRPIFLDDPSRGQRGFGYDEFGGLLTETVGGEIRSNVYDHLGRITSRTTRDGLTSWSWDTSANGIGKLGWTSSPSGVTTTLQYNANSQLTDELQTIGSQSYDTTVVPDSFGRITAVYYPPVKGVRFGLQYTYGTRGAFYEIDEILPQSIRPVWTALEVDAGGYATNPSGRFPQYRLGNGIDVHYYESVNRPGLLGNIQSTVGSKTIQSLSYTFDSKDNVSARADLLNPLGLQESFTPDELNRLQYWTVTSSAGDQSRVRFDYDDSGNMTARTYELGDGSNSTYGVTEERGGGPYAVTTANTTLYSYDGIEGNQTQAGQRSATFAEFGLPLTFSQMSNSYQFRYTSAGSRAEKTATNFATDDTVYCAGGAFRSHTRGGATDYAYTVFGPTGPVAYLSAGADGTIATTSYLLQDYRGSTDAIVDADTKLVTERRNFDPFGSLFDASDPTGPSPSLGTPVPYGFTGHEHDWDLGLVNMKGRLYDPSLGRFISPDPIGTTMGTSLGMNGYAYVSNNPETLWDPTGFGERGGTTGGGTIDPGGGGNEPTGGPVGGRGDFHTYVSGGSGIRHYIATSRAKLLVAAVKSFLAWRSYWTPTMVRWADPTSNQSYFANWPVAIVGSGSAMEYHFGNFFLNSVYGGGEPDWKSAAKGFGSAALLGAEVGVAIVTAGAGLVVAEGAEVGRVALQGPTLITDPGLAQFVARLDGAGIKVTGMNINMVGEGGKVLGEVDVVTESALIQYKNGPSSAHAVIDQVTLRTEPFVTRPVITFINDTGRAGARTVSGAGGRVLITNDFDTLVDVLR